MPEKSASEWWRRIRNTLDLLATVTVIVTGTAVSFVAVSTYRERTMRVEAVRTMGGAVPKDPQSLQGAEVLGNAGAKVAIIEYSDFQCPYCAEFALRTWPALRDAYVGTGKVKIAFKHLPLPIHPGARHAAEAAHCAGRQGKFWELHDRLFESRGQLDDRKLLETVSALRLDGQMFQSCLNGQASPEVSNQLAEAESLGISSTPTFLIGAIQPDGRVAVSRVLPGALPLSEFKRALDTVIAEQTRVAER